MDFHTYISFLSERRTLESTIVSWQEKRLLCQPPAGGNKSFCNIFLSLTSARLMVSKEPGPPGQPRVQDLRLEQEENLKVGSEKRVVGWQAVVTWDPADTPEGRTFTLQCCRCSP